tara:strand:+ start:1207 stop:1665 length:459 start_codon:yes stop_codon:yes gene_type:complete
MTRFKINWVLSDELAIGPAPLKESDFIKLKDNNIKSILNLCSEEEAPVYRDFIKDFTHRRFTLPDHKVNKNILVSEIKEIIEIIEIIKDKGPLFIHCYAARERSPIICMSWLVVKHNLSPQRALDYLMEVNPRTNPLPSQFKLLFSLNNLIN